MDTPQTERLCLSVLSASKAVGLSRSMVYELIKADAFPHVHWGDKRITVPVAALKEYLRNRVHGQGEVNRASPTDQGASND